MSAKVRVVPSGHEFFVGRHETLLEAGLAAGLALQYHCSNGSCGECKARVVSGEINEVGHYDYRFTEAEKSQGCTLMCRTTAASDLVIEAGEALGVADMPLQELKAKVTKLERLADDLLVVHLRTPRSHTLRFLAGQYVTLEIDGLPPRDKSIASCPCSGMLLQVHFRKRDGDPFPEHVFSKLRTSDKVLVTGPFGEFTLDEQSKRPIIFLAYETGFGSVKSLIEHAIALDLEQPLHLPAGGDPLGLRVARSIEPLWEDHPDLAGSDLYMSIPVGTENPITQSLLEHGLPEPRLRMELLEKY